MVIKLALLTLLLGLDVLVPPARTGDQPQSVATTSGQATVRPKELISLYNGKSFEGLSTWLEDTKHADPRKVFRVTTEGWLQITGDGFGYVATTREYHDYRLIVEYKWGRRTDGGKFVRNAGILLNAVGPDGGAGGKWMSSVECQLAQGCVGDLIVIRGKDAAGATVPVQLSSDVSLGSDKRPRWTKGGESKRFAGDRQLWWSRHDPEFQELLDTRGKEDLESQVGDWTRVEIWNERRGIKIFVNGILVNAAYDLFPSAGKILLQSEGFELFVRKFELLPLQD